MLTSLYISNIVLIEKLNLEFGSGLNILTGETGAGKRDYQNHHGQESRSAEVQVLL